MPTLKTGGRFKSAVCAGEIMVVAASSDDVELTCGGVAMVEAGSDAPEGAVPRRPGSSWGLSQAEIPPSRTPDFLLAFLVVLGG